MDFPVVASYGRRGSPRYKRGHDLTNINTPATLVPWSLVLCGSNLLGHFIGAISADANALDTDKAHLAWFDLELRGNFITASDVNCMHSWGNNRNSIPVNIKVNETATIYPDPRRGGYTREMKYSVNIDRTIITRFLPRKGIARSSTGCKKEEGNQ
ncbi:MAG: hypothetical protein K8S54_13205 [Spirochaetia bacterium]|nr:hypothetical protein [Spirochaetia bacterium]